MPPSRRDDLIDAAMRVFYRHGFHGSNLDRVLEEGGISRMTLYNHFKSKEELIVAALRRRDEIFRSRLLEFVEGRADDPRERLLAVFDFCDEFVTSRDFHGCMFINASAEFSDEACAIRRVAAEHKRLLVQYLTEQCAAARLDTPGTVAEQVAMLLDGAVVHAHVAGQVGAMRTAKDAASKLIECTSAG